MIPPGDVVELRLKNLEADMRDEREARRRSVERLEEKKADQDDLKTLAEEVHGLRRALVLFSLTMIGTAIVFLMGVLALVQTP
jgi:phage terminase Nu1 subunit (DNA packaging protein)